MQARQTGASGSASKGRRLMISGSVLAFAAGLAAAPASRAADAAAAVSPGTTIEAVTVTARKKEERLLDVPVAATVLNATTINRYDTTDLIQLSTIAPGVIVTRTGGGTPGGAIYIRGIGIFGPDYASEQPVELVLDGMPITRGHFIDSGFFDQSSIQILKGPQSTFYGKNSPGGVVDITSTNPIPGHGFSGYVKGSYGISTEDPIVEAAVSIPVTDTLAVRLAMRAEDMQGGYISDSAKPLGVNPLSLINPATGKSYDPFYNGVPTASTGANFDKYPKTKQLVERFTAVWKPTSNFDATLKVLGSYFHDNASFGSQGIAGPCLGTASLPSNGNPLYTGALGGAWVDPGYTCHQGNTNTNDSTPPQAVLQHFLGAPETVNTTP